MAVLRAISPRPNIRRQRSWADSKYGTEECFTSCTDAATCRALPGMLCVSSKRRNATVPEPEICVVLLQGIQPRVERSACTTTFCLQVVRSFAFTIKLIAYQYTVALFDA